MTLFLVLSQTVLQLPVLINAMVVIKILASGILPKLFFLALISNIILLVNFLMVLLYSLKFINLEVPNDEIPWSHNQTGGIYIKILFKTVLASQELYRNHLDNKIVLIVILSIVIALEVLVLVYRMNTPSIFNTIVHNCTLLFESLLLALTLIGFISQITSRDILSTLAYLFIFIPVIVRVVFWFDERRKHLVIFKLKSEDNLSNNEYLIALTYLLKMIKRQSETDIAQLLSFTYYHKLQCYDTGCICQFFTQYCQDPAKFKAKKRRTYRGYLDDGQKLIENSIQTGLKQYLEMNLQDSQSEQQQNQNNLASKDLELIQSVGESACDSNLDQTQLSQIDMNQVNTVVNDIQVDDQNGSNELAEIGIMSLFVKGQILRGSAYNTYDRNMDFKIKGEFKSPSIFKNVYDSRTYFFTRLLETMFKQLESRTNKNSSFTLINIYFQFEYQHNVYQSISNLVKLSKALKRSMFQKMTFSVSEFFILEMILNDFKKSSKDEVDYSTFIESSQMQQKLDWLFEDSTVEILEFWQIFKEEQANVQKAYVLAMSISGKIQTISSYISTLEEQQMIKDYNKYYYYAMFYQNLLNDKIGYNQMILNLKNLITIRNMRKKNNRANGGSLDDINDIGFAILSYEDEKVVGKFNYCNRVACSLLYVSEEEIIGKSVNYIMPETIRANHEQFYKKFQSDGLPRIMGKVRNLYVKTFNDYIRPVQFYLNFHYSHQFSYSLILHIDPIAQISIFNSNSFISIKYCVIFLCNEANTILNMSSSVRKIFGLSKNVVKEQEEILGRSLKMEDVVFQMVRMEQLIEQNNVTFLQNQQVRVRNFKESDDQSYISCSLSYEQVTYLKGFQTQFSEKVYLLIPSSKIPDLEQTNSQVLSSNQYNSFGVSASSDPNFFAFNSADVNSQNAEDNGEKEVFVSGISGSMSSMSKTSDSSLGSTTSVLSYTKDLLFRKKTPKILTVYLYIVFGVFFSFMIITSVNFIIYIQKKNHINLEIQFNLLINQRNTYLSQTLINLKQLHIISLNSTNDAAINSSSIFPEQDRFTYYSQQLTYKQDKLQEAHQDFKKISQRFKDLGSSTQEEFDQVIYKMVGQNGRSYVQNNSLDFGIQLLVSNLGMINPYQLSVEQIPLNTQEYLSKLKSNQSVSQLFKSLYFIYENGLTSLNFKGISQERVIQENILDTSDNSKLYINLISFISIGIITMIGIFTFPLLGKIEDRKISVLKFFNLLSTVQIQDLIKKGKEFEKEFQMLSKSINKYQANNQKEEDKVDDDRDNWHQSSDSGEYEKVKKQKDLINIEEVKSDDIYYKKQNTLGNQGKDDDDLDIPKVVSFAANTKKYNNPIITKKLSMHSNQFHSVKEIKNILEKIQKNEISKKKSDPKKRKSQMKMNDAFSGASKGKSLVEKIEEEIKENYQKQNKRSQQYQVEEVDEQIEVEQDDKDEVKYSKKRRSGKVKHNDDSYDKKSIGLRDQTQRSEYIQEQLEKVALKEKLKLALYVIFVLVFLNSCLFSCYYIGQKTFQDDQKTLNSLGTFYHRENCLDNLLLYTMEQFIINSTLSFNSKDKSAYDFFQNSCQDTEKDYNDLRKELPTFLVDISGQLDDIESSNMCQMTYKLFEKKQQTCEIVYDSLLKRGLTSTFYMIFTYCQNLNVRFQNEQRTKQFLYDRIYDVKLRDVVDLVNYYIEDSLEYMEDLVTTTAVDYFDSLASTYLIIFACYMGVSVVMCFVFGFFIFKKLRQQIMTSANILAIIPLEDLDSRDRVKIESFLNS